MFLIRCRQGKVLKETTPGELSAMYNQLVNFTGKRSSDPNLALDEMNLFLDSLVKTWPNIFVSEVVGAYFLAVKERLTDNEGNTIKLFPIVDLRSCSELINAFARYFNNQFNQKLKSQTFWHEDTEPKRPTFEQLNERFEIQFDAAVNIYKTQGNYDVAGADLFLYDVLKRKGLVNLTDEQKEEYFDKAFVIVKAELFQEKKQSNSIGRMVDIAKMIDTLTPENMRVIHKARNLILNDILKLIQNDKINIDDVKNAKWNNS